MVEPDRNIEELTDEEIYSAVSYLERADEYLEPDSSASEQDHDNGTVVSVYLYIVMVGCLAFVWLYCR